jgi:hypothetical protein
VGEDKWLSTFLGLADGDSLKGVVRENVTKFPKDNNEPGWAG